jgi:hypothetical protein
VKVGVGKNEQPFVDIRQYWMPPDGDEWAPTKKGVRLHAENLERLREVFATADAELDKLYK